MKRQPGRGSISWQPWCQAVGIGGDEKHMKEIKWRVQIVFLLPILLLTAATGMAVGEAGDIAIQGYDPVAYFREGGAAQGESTFSLQFDGKTWHFTSSENRDLFAANPESYAPQYDGYCAWALTEGRLAETDPQVWKIVDGKLYLNCSREAYEKWSRDIPGNIDKADAQWLTLQPRPAS